MKDHNILPAGWTWKHYDFARSCPKISLDRRKEIIVYDHTSHPFNIKILTAFLLPVYNFVADSSRLIQGH